MTPDNRPYTPQGMGRGPETAREFKTVLREILPCWHELSWENEGPTLVLRIHQNYVDALSVKPDAPIVAHFQKAFELGNFEGDLRGNFGFNEALKNRGEKDGFYEYAIEIPSIMGPTDVVCDRCDGTGRDEDLDTRCLRCEGGGKELHYEWGRAHEISTSLSILTSRLGYYDYDVPTTVPQLLTFESSCGPGHSALHGEIGIALREWFVSAGLNEARFPGAEAAMEAAYKKLFGPRVGFVAHLSFDARTQNSGLSLECPGDACGIYPGNWNFREGQGYKFSSHNMDTPAQQLTILAGLAALHDLTRRRMSA